ncbi:cyclase [Penicillium chermesinum]|uniref:Cyclase n=1 Tax=Penicillium chermesinum TaxID=63820 RepID=A0A9W9NYS8_9EURO|nr:cyclase [Penicillium chermesinum]KAJ5232276.1 cyclase [Penicillium chermesinum]
MAKPTFDTPLTNSPIRNKFGLENLAVAKRRVAAAAAGEIRTGRRVTMGWELTKLDYPNLNRQPCDHKIVPLLGGYSLR